MVIQNQSHQWKFGDVGLTLRGDIQCDRPKVLLILVMWVFSLAMAEVTEGGIKERERWPKSLRVASKRERERDDGI